MPSILSTLALAVTGLAGLTAAAPQVTSSSSSSSSSSAFLGLAPFPAPPAQGNDPLTVKLGYGTYQGVHNATTGLNVWKGVGFAAPPVGNLRWQPPRVPPTKSGVVVASDYGPTCPISPPSVPGTPFAGGNEDCLYLNVWAPSTASASAKKKLPVYVYIHGGGYGMGDGRYDLSGLVNENNNQFIAVTIQYRLGAFGWLSSADVYKNGVVNAGLLDQVYALEWVQNYIGLFGGDASQVTISGESAGAGSVMYHAMGAGGKAPVTLFKNGHAASPYLVPQYNYDAAVPTQRYNAFAAAAGCSTAKNVFACLVAADTLTLQYASSNVSVEQTAFATWAFVPVTDGCYVTERPSVQLATGAVNGVNILVGNNADEGVLFTPGGITSEATLASWIQTSFPGLSATNVSAVVAEYASNYTGTALFETNGISPPNANQVSQAGSGYQQQAYNIYAESTFVCPAYWLTGAFTQKGKSAFQYQYSVPFAYHQSDVSAYLGPPTPNQGPNFVTAFRQLLGGITVRSNPSILASTALSAFSFPAWTSTSHQLVNLNQTGGVPVEVPEFWGGTSLQYNDPGLQNAFSVADASTWEGGRAARCDFWKTMAAYLPQ
ncbi:hypothetical protein SBRCBS47491_009037 [Sporothrix bragantina]|uniref:Carboxylic ester hydrolase n=1 Tax=Sporothrix bragantina TaxID=671064 RepID=A0ABP0CRQ0_9PEZI